MQYLKHPASLYQKFVLWKRFASGLFIFQAMCPLRLNHGSDIFVIPRAGGDPTNLAQIPQD